MQSFVKTAVKNLKKNASYLKKQSFVGKAASEWRCHNPIYARLCWDITRQNLPAISNYRQICIYLSTSCSSHVTVLYVKFYCETAFHFGFKHCVKGCYEESETRKVALGDSKKKKGKKKVDRNWGFNAMWWWWRWRHNRLGINVIKTDVIII